MVKHMSFEDAKRFGDLREEGSGNTPTQRSMDLHNNAVGRELALFQLSIPQFDTRLSDRLVNAATGSTVVGSRLWITHGGRLRYAGTSMLVRGPSRGRAP
jgi:hypothetical protein